MKVTCLLLIISLTIGLTNGNAQNSKTMQDQKNPLLCKPEAGICETPNNNNKSISHCKASVQNKPVKIIYFTDPICSSCWGIESQLRKLKFEYGNTLEIEYRMGGLLKDWSYNSGGISKPSDVAHHWDEVSQYYDMPIDGDIWLEDPLMSSYPPSIAFKAAQLQDQEKALLFLREIRELVFLKKTNITKWEHLGTAATKVGIDPIRFKSDFEGKATDLFLEDLKLSSELGVRGFPTLFFTNANGQKELVYGAKPYSNFENALLKIDPTASKYDYDKNWFSVFSKYNSLTAKEFSDLTNIPRKEAEKKLNELSSQGHLEIFKTKNGDIWTLKTVTH